jgi:hypothetical protein
MRRRKGKKDIAMHVITVLPLLETFALEDTTGALGIEIELCGILCRLANTYFAGIEGRGSQRQVSFISRRTGCVHSALLTDVAHGGAELIRNIAREGDSFLIAEFSDALEFENLSLI